MLLIYIRLPFWLEIPVSKKLVMSDDTCKQLGITFSASTALSFSECWKYDPTKRPGFSVICRKLRDVTDADVVAAYGTPHEAEKSNLEEEVRNVLKVSQIVRAGLRVMHGCHDCTHDSKYVTNGRYPRFLRGYEDGEQF